MSTYYLNNGEKRFLNVKTDHDWRKKKRRELRAVEKAAQTLLLASAFTPMSALCRPETPMSLLELIQHMRKKYSVKGWGR
jgi:hypothetical protein